MLYFSCFKTTLRTVFEFYSHRKSTEELKTYLSSHEPEVRGLDDESRFLLATMIKEKRLKKQLLKKIGQGKEKEDDDMCEAIQGMIDEGKEEGRIAILKKLVETKDISIEIAARTLGTTVEEIEVLFSKI